MIRTVAQTPFERWLGKWHSALPYNVDIADLVSDETLENLSAATNRTVTVERSKRGNNLFYVVSRLDSPDGIPARVLYSKVIQWYPSSDHAKTPWCAGVTSDRRVKWFNLEDTPHILVAGSTHSGKSNHINAMIATIVTMSSPAEVRLLLVDNKGGVEFTHWAGTAHLLRPMVKQVDHVLPTLKFAREIMERRLARFEAIKAKNLASFNDKVKVDQRIPRIVVVVDELATLLGLGDLTTDIQHELRVLTSQGRATGVHVIACTQHSSVDVLPGWVKTNMVMRIAGKMPTASASLTIANSATAASLPDIPGRLLFAIGSHEWIAQSPLISDDEIARAVAISRDYPAPDNMEFEQPEQIRIEQRFGRDDFLNLVVNEFDLKLSPQAIHQKYGNDLAPLREIRAIFDAIKTLKVIEYEGLTYRVKRLGNLYKLIPEPVIQQGADEDTESVTVLESEEAPVLP
jgi:DNA segregation ATPase FtsK/SpoIIIE-like protein